MNDMPLKNIRTCSASAAGAAIRKCNWQRNLTNYLFDKKLGKMWNSILDGKHCLRFSAKLHTLVIEIIDNFMHKQIKLQKKKT